MCHPHFHYKTHRMKCHFWSRNVLDMRGFIISDFGVGFLNSSFKRSTLPAKSPHIDGVSLLRFVFFVLVGVPGG